MSNNFKMDRVRNTTFIAFQSVNREAINQLLQTLIQNSSDVAPRETVTTKRLARGIFPSSILKVQCDTCNFPSISFNGFLNFGNRTAVI